MTLTPAYGRNYTNKAAVLADFEANKDFVLQHMGRSQYINKAQIPSGTFVQFRFDARLSRVLGHKVQ